MIPNIKEKWTSLLQTQNQITPCESCFLGGAEKGKFGLRNVGIIQESFAVADPGFFIGGGHQPRSGVPTPEVVTFQKF